MKRSVNHKVTNNFVLEHIKANVNIYLIISIIFVLGIIIGVLLFNNLPKSELDNSNAFISNSISLIKEHATISKLEALKNSMINNIFIVFVIWIFGISLLGKHLLRLFIIVLGICFGLTLSSITYCFSFTQAILFIISTMLLQNIIKIPALAFLCSQGSKIDKELKLYHNTIAIIAKYSIICLIVLTILLICSFIEIYVSEFFLLN